jgi:uncharacterized membrane protein
MQDDQKDLGRLIAVHPVAPLYVQRAIFVALLSFVFFAAMMLAFYIRQSMLYFLLATAFLFVYLITMFSWFNHRKSTVKVYERGIEYRSHTLEWTEIATVSEEKAIVITPKTGKPFELPSVISEPAALARNIRFRSEASNKS